MKKWIKILAFFTVRLNGIRLYDTQNTFYLIVRGLKNAFLMPLMPLLYCYLKMTFLVKNPFQNTKNHNPGPPRSARSLGQLHNAKEEDAGGGGGGGGQHRGGGRKEKEGRRRRKTAPARSFHLRFSLMMINHNS